MSSKDGDIFGTRLLYVVYFCNFNKPTWYQSDNIHFYHRFKSQRSFMWTITLRTFSQMLFNLARQRLRRGHQFGSNNGRGDVILEAAAESRLKRTACTCSSTEKSCFSVPTLCVEASSLTWWGGRSSGRSARCAFKSDRKITLPRSVAAFVSLHLKS
jgi:hypothetical protein